MRLFLDTNVWSYFADHDAGDTMARTAGDAGNQILVSPTVVDELRRLPGDGIRRRALRLVARNDWVRLMPDSFAECAEIKAEIRRLRPQWMLPRAALADVRRLRYDWVRRKGGFWERTAGDLAPRPTDESLRAEREGELARREAYEIRRRVHAKKVSRESRNLQHVATLPDPGTNGWDGMPVEYWRVPSLHFFGAELLVYASPVREWLDAEVDVAAMLADLASMNRHWLYEMSALNVPRQWLRGAFEFLQSWRKVTDGSPVDSQLATHLVEADRFVTADKNFPHFAERCAKEAPFRTALAERVPGGRDGVDAVLRLAAVRG